MRIGWLVSTIVGLAAWAPGRASAEVEGAASETVWLGGSVGVSPVGSLKISSQGAELTTDTATAYQVNALVDFHLAPAVSLGFAPGVLFNVKGNTGTESATMIDLPVRLAIGGLVAPSLRIYGFASPGYAFLLLPSNNGGGEVPTPSGFMIGFGGGLQVRVAPKLAITGELGYQYRFTSASQDGIDGSFQVDYLTFAIGLAGPVN